MARRVKNRQVSANRGFARGGSLAGRRKAGESVKNAGKVFGALLLVFVLAGTVIAFVFGIRIIFADGPKNEPERITVRYSEDVSERFDRSEIYKNGVLYLNFDRCAEVLGLTKSRIGDEISYFSGSGDSIIFTLGSGTLYLNKIPTSAGGVPFISKDDEFMVPADIINMYVNESSVTVSADGKNITLVSVIADGESVTFNLKKSEIMEGMSRPSSIPPSTVYDPSGTLPPEETTVAVPETTTSAESETQSPEDVINNIISSYVFKTNVSAVKEYLNPVDKEKYLILANRKNPLGKDYVPSNLTAINSSYTAQNKTYKLSECAQKALEAMVAEMKACGVWDTYVCSTYRTYEYQETLYNRYIKQETLKNPTLSEEDIIKIVDSYSARPGTSDHQTGLCVDFYDVEITFEKKAAFKWLKENAYKFGFILRFPDGKTDITGYSYEPWHWRFVGQAAAYEIWKGGLTLEEYVGG